jgi:hypothetical protein
MTEEQIDCEEKAKLGKNQTLSKAKNIQSRKRMNLIKRLEATITMDNSNYIEAEQEHVNIETNLGKTNKSLSILYLLSTIVFTFMCALFGLKLYLRFDFKTFIIFSLETQNNCNIRTTNIGKIM